uniref:Nucleotide-diphospho-sugar transferase domain-containing protein n=1 Tax=viral metagenome TaxID=1070528 RepID=A0A6C0DQ65_9ZZZZ
MNIILFCVNNFQEYIIPNIQQLIALGNKNIYVITNAEFFIHFETVKTHIELINVYDLNDVYNFANNARVDSHFRNGFWTLTSLRFFYIYDLMKTYHLTDVIHIENDVLIYYNVDELKPSLNSNYVYLPFDCYNRNIASIMYIPNSDIFKIVLDNYNFGVSDMDNFSTIKWETGLIETFPIFPLKYAITDEQKYVSKNYDDFHFIFDAAAIGQYLGGIDPFHTLEKADDEKNTEGFVNETCVIKYNTYNIRKINVNGFLRPFIEINNEQIPIFNLHIHSKNLSKFLCF